MQLHAACVDTDVWVLGKLSYRDKGVHMNVSFTLLLLYRLVLKG